jgi:hypothetical protein
MPPLRDGRRPLLRPRTCKGLWSVPQRNCRLCWLRAHLAPGQPKPEVSDLAPRLRTLLLLHPQEIISHYDGIRKLKGLQRTLSQQIPNHRLHTFLVSAECTNSGVVRLTSCRHKPPRDGCSPPLLSPSTPTSAPQS